MNQSTAPGGPSQYGGRRDVTGHLLVFAATAAGGAALLLIALLFLWLNGAASTVTDQGAHAITIRAVMRADVDAVGAEKVAQRIRQQVPDSTIEVISETVGRSLLALQEPWIAKMPDFEVTPLPILIEVHHPALLTNPAEVQQFVKQLGTEPEVDFVAYNETAHNRLVKLASSLGAIQQHALRWLTAAIAFAGFVLVIFAVRQMPNATWAVTLAAGVVFWVIVWMVGWPVYHAWETPMVASQEYVRLSYSDFWPVAAWSLILTIAATLLGKSWKCRRR